MNHLKKAKDNIRQLITYYSPHNPNLSRLVGRERVFSCILALRSRLELRQVAVVVTLHFQVEDLGIAVGCGSDELRVEELENAVADGGQLGLDLRSVAFDGGDVGLVASALLLLLDGGDYPPGGTAGADDVLVGDGEEVALLDGELVAVDGTDDLLHELDHLLVALGLLGELGHVHILLAWGRH
ncbi:ribonuclease HII [Striga asiatica]|uniref:Ribonuclease HII n=1 Tax=Striga asiatica TaxID=4170 RepID=A0A5A7P0T4_STRAF|nr:ribonuclease HII [Striga asiatica]